MKAEKEAHAREREAQEKQMSKEKEKRKKMQQLEQKIKINEYKIKKKIIDDFLKSNQIYSIGRPAQLTQTISETEARSTCLRGCIATLTRPCGVSTADR